jgi:Fe-S oxidoreductase
MNPVAMFLLLLGFIGLFLWSATRRWAQLMKGAPEPSFSIADGEFFRRCKELALYALGQKKMAANEKYRIAGLAHMAIFGGFMVVQLRTLMLWGRGFDADFDFWGLLAHGTLLGGGYSFVKDLFASLVLLGVFVFAGYRIYYSSFVKVERDKRMTLSGEAYLILFIIGSMMAMDMVYDGASFALMARAKAETLHFMPEEFAGSIFAFAFQDLSSSALVMLRGTGFWWHAAMPLVFLNILPFSKHFHIITSLPNVFLRSNEPVGALPNVEDIEGKVEREEPVGLKTITDLTWKNLLDLYTCTECGRCSDNCPAFITGKPLSPKHLTLALRDHLYEAEAELTGLVDAPLHPIDGNAEEKVELHTFPHAPKDAYFRSTKVVDLIPNIMSPDVIWACTTCRACEEQCPVQISYVDKIVGLRREMVMMKNEFPAALMKPFNAMETNGNPWNYSQMDRADWADGLDVPLISDSPNVDVLYWVGCAASYDDRAKKVARATAKLLKHAGVKFAILGTDETCTGDPARRAGNEYLFQILAQQNIETLKSVGADKKVVLTTCPHCFNALLNDYPQFGGKFDVVHHSDYLNGLVARGVLVPTKPVEGKIAFHDSCYLGRYNGVYESPRKILEAIPGVDLVEVPYWNKQKGLCCGAGGAQMWMEEHGERVNVKRSLQLIDTGAKTLASGCPFCMTMITDGIKSQDKEDSIKSMDLAELLAASIEMGDSEQAAEAAE